MQNINFFYYLFNFLPSLALLSSDLLIFFTILIVTKSVFSLRMMKLSLFCPLFALLSIALLLPSPTTAASSGNGFLSEICEKCEYCKIDTTCSGCQQCASCENRKQEGCRFCKEQETVEGCVKRCKRGCRICAGKDGEGLDRCKN